MMSNLEHINFLLNCSLNEEEGNRIWNSWRKNNNIASINLSNVDLKNIKLLDYNLSGIDFSNSDLSGAILIDSTLVESNFNNALLTSANLAMTKGGSTIFKGANMHNINLQNAIYSGSDFTDADLTGLKGLCAMLINCNFTRAILHKSNLVTSILAGSNFTSADLTFSHLNGANLSNTDLSDANISYSLVFGSSVWNIQTKDLIQKDLEITNDGDQNKISVDDIEVAQFIYLISNNRNLSSVINTITSKVVLILGRFTEERKRILDAIKEELRKGGYIAVVFDFEKPNGRDLTETIGLLGRMSKFIVADLTDPSSIPHELYELIPNNPDLVFKPIILKGNLEYSMFEHWKKYPWVLPIYEYESLDTMISNIDSAIIEPVDEYINSKNI